MCFIRAASNLSALQKSAICKNFKTLIFKKYPLAFPSSTNTHTHRHKNTPSLLLNSKQISKGSPRKKNIFLEKKKFKILKRKKQQQQHERLPQVSFFVFNFLFL